MYLAEMGQVGSMFMTENVSMATMLHCNAATSAIQ